MDLNYKYSYIAQPENYKEAIRNGEEFYIKFPVLNSEIEALLIRFLHRYLESYDVLYLKDMLFPVLKELINNSVKANVKRQYFKSKNLKIEDKNDYRLGMESFKDEVYYSSGSNNFFKMLEDAKLSVKVIFENKPEEIVIHVRNNSPIIEEELQKIRARVGKAYKYEDISEAFDDVLDDSEGAGLGLIMALMLFKNTGLEQDSFKIYKDEDFTVATIKIPQKLIRTESQSKLTDEISREVDKIPSFPENITEIQRLCSDPNSTIEQIADGIKRDPGLTTNILKLANSAGYITLNRIKSIQDAVKIIGMKGISTLLLASGVKKIIESRYKRFENVWANSDKTAFYANKISEQLRGTKYDYLVYLAALLVDIGKIVLLSLHPKKSEKMKKIAGMKGLATSAVLEEMTLGISHSTLGGLILAKWNFMEELIKTIEFHHRPHMSPEKYKSLIYTVYLAHEFTEIEERKSKYEIIDEDVLNYFNIKNKEDLIMLHRILKDAYTASFNNKEQ